MMTNLNFYIFIFISLKPPFSILVEQVKYPYYGKAPNSV